MRILEYSARDRVHINMYWGVDTRGGRILQGMSLRGLSYVCESVSV